MHVFLADFFGLLVQVESRKNFDWGIKEKKFVNKPTCLKIVGVATLPAENGRNAAVAQKGT